MRRTAILILSFCLAPACVWGATAVLTAFASGEITPRLWGRTDVLTFYSGTRTVENMFVKPHGPAEKRPGTAYIATAAGKGRVLSFQGSSGETNILEFTDKVIRFYK